MNVTFCILQIPPHMNGPSDSQTEPHSSALSLGLIVAVVATAALFAFIYTRHSRKPF